MEINVERERQQLLEHWTGLCRKRPDWLSNELGQVRRVMAASNADDRAKDSLASCLRQFHDKLGFKAKGALSGGGLCAGAIYRTEEFMRTDERIGSKRGQTVHIEHTVPIKVLRTEIVKLQFPNYTATLVWLLKHSVATAFNEREKSHLTGWASNSEAFDPSSCNYLKPFARYDKLHSAEGAVWNVFDRTKIDPERFTFRDHLDVVMRLLVEAGATSHMLLAMQK